MKGLLYTKGYSAQGIEMEWGPMTILGNSARMAVSDDFSETLADLTVAIVEQLARRSMVFSHGLPRRQVCVLDEALFPDFVTQLRSDLAIHEKIKDLTFDGVDMYLERSVFNHMAVRQLVGCLQEENWERTPRTSAGAEFEKQTPGEFSLCVPILRFSPSDFISVHLQ